MKARSSSTTTCISVRSTAAGIPGPLLARAKCLRQRHAEPIFENDSDYPLSRSAQCIRVPRSSRLFTDGKKGDQSIDLVGKGDDHAHRRGWAIITRAKRSVMFGDRVGDPLALAVMERVIAAHDPLQFGELADHASRQIGLGEVHCSLRQSVQFSVVIPAKGGIQSYKLRAAALGHRLRGGSTGRGVKLLREEHREPLHPLDLVVNAAELVVIDALFQRLDPVFEPDLAVLVPEEAGVGEPGAQHALVAGDDGLAAVFGQIVGDEQKMWRRPASRDKHRKNISDARASPSARPRAATS